jgi:hypothetical protein
MSDRVTLNRISELYGVDASDPAAIRVGAMAEPAFGIVKAAKVAIGAVSTGEKDTGFDLPTKGIVLDVFVDVTTLEATATTKTIDVGLLSSESGGDADGFLDGASTAAAAVVRGSITVTDGSNQNFIAAAPTLGALLRSGVLGTDAAGESAALIKTPHVLNGTAKSLTYTLGSTHTELVGAIYVVYIDMTE